MAHIEAMNLERSLAEEEGLLLAEYRAISPQTVVGMLLGLASAIALSTMAFWFLPPIALWINIKALREIARQSPALGGRKVALAGLALSLIFGISAPLHAALYYRHLRAGAIAISRDWFIALRESQPERARNLSQPFFKRSNVPDLRSLYNSEAAVKLLDQYCDQPAVRLLLKLGKRAHVRHYAHVSLSEEDEGDRVVDLYVVTVGAEPGTSYFIQLKLVNRIDMITKNRGWEVFKAELVAAPPPATKVDEA